MTGLNRSTVAALVGELVALELLVESGPDATNAVGRPSPQVRPHPGPVAIAVNPEVDAVTIGLVGLAGTVLHRERVEVDHVVTPVEAADIVADAVRRMEGGALASRTVVGIGIAVPGLVRSGDGLVRWAPHLEWSDEPVTELVAERTGYRTVAGNDASLGALAEHIFGSGRGVDDLVYLNGGASGIGGGVIANGLPLGGVGGYAGEFGQNRVGVEAKSMRASSPGTLESEVSRARLIAAVGLVSADEEQLADAILASDDPAVRVEIVRQAGILSVALGNAINVLNPRLVVLGGFLATLHAYDPGALESRVSQQAVAVSFEGVKIVPAALRSNLLMIGAAQIAFEKLLEDPAGGFAPYLT